MTRSLDRGTVLIVVGLVANQFIWAWDMIKGEDAITLGTWSMAGIVVSLVCLLAGLYLKLCRGRAGA